VVAALAGLAATATMTRAIRDAAMRVRARMFMPSLSALGAPSALAESAWSAALEA
jgi:hypothetical protein